MKTRPRFSGLAMVAVWWLLVFLPSGFAQKAPDGDKPTMTREAFLQQIAAGQIIRGQVIPGDWLMTALTAADTEPAKKVALYLTECRVVGSTYIMPKNAAVYLWLTTVAFDRDLIILDGGEALDCLWSDVQIAGDLSVVFDGQHEKGRESVNWRSGSIGGSVRIDGGIRAGIFAISEVTVGKHVYFEHFGAQEYSVRLVSLKIGGDLVFAADGFPPGAHWDGSGVPPVLEPPSLFSVWMGNVNVGGYTVFRGCEMRVLDGDAVSMEFQPTQSAGRAFFQNCRIARAHLSRVNFKQEVRFSRCDLGELWLDDAVFEKDVTFHETDFGPPAPAASASASAQRFRPPASAPSPGPVHLAPDQPLPQAIGGVSMEDTRFEGKLRLDWEKVQLPGGAWFSPRTPPTVIVSRRAGGEPQWGSAQNAPASAQTWDNLHEAWLASGEGEGANEADYRSKGLDEHGGGAGLWVWGFGYRPIRPLLWAGGVVLGCACAFRTQVPRGRSATARWKTALDFSAQAAWKWTYGWEKTRGWAWTTFALGEQAAVKVFLLLFAKALANTSPLLKEITDKLIPFE